MVTTMDTDMEVDVLDGSTTTRTRRRIDHYEGRPSGTRDDLYNVLPVPELREGEQLQWIIGSTVPLIVAVYKPRKEE